MTAIITKVSNDVSEALERIKTRSANRNDADFLEWYLGSAIDDEAKLAIFRVRIKKYTRKDFDILSRCAQKA